MLFSFFEFTKRKLLLKFAGKSKKIGIIYANISLTTQISFYHKIGKRIIFDLILDKYFYVVWL